MGRPLPRDQKAHLASALEGLPPEIAYLREMILAIADEDQDLLGSGEVSVDPTPLLVNALQQRGHPHGINALAADDAEVLHAWSESLPDRDAAWAGPIACAEGLLRGFALYYQLGHEEDSPPAPAPPSSSPFEMDIPPGMKTKLYAEGLEARDRHVQMFVLMVPDERYDYIRKMLRSPPAGSVPPHLRDEVDSTFRLGAVSGMRCVSRHVETDLAVAATYVLLLSDIKLEATIISRKDTGMDLDKYEPLLATIRRK